MFKIVKLQNFKKFSDSKFQLKPQGLSLLAGGNNSGKSTLLQSLAVWDFCIAVLQNERGIEAILPGFSGQGIGLSDDEFSPILIPALNHLWTNLTNQIQGKDGYSLSIRPIWETTSGVERHLEIGLALANDRLFIKQLSSNLGPEDKIPRVGYVPPFAGISAKEQKMSVAQRRAMVGSGLVGGIIRNILLDLEIENQRKRADLKAGREKIKNSDLKLLRENDPWEILQSAIGRYFQTSLTLEPFNDLYHTYIRVKLVKGTWDQTRIKKFPKFKPRDLMAEGSGFLQWLSVFALALDPRIDVVLLDEPDAHLHSSMQTLLMSELERIAASNKKQVLLATHSTEILRWAQHQSILRFKNNGASYLSDDGDKVGLFAGLGSDYSPRLDRLRKSKALLLVEGKSDAIILKKLAECLGRPISNEIVFWPSTASSKERRQLFNQLKRDIPNLKAVSIRDRDNTEQNLVDATTLRDKTEKTDTTSGLQLCVWQRRHIENYLLSPRVISRAANCTIEEVEQHFMLNHGIAIPSEFTASNVLQVIKDAHGKEIFEVGEKSIQKVFGVSKFDVCNHISADDVCEDIIVLIDAINKLISP